MANLQLFNTRRGAQLPASDALNEAGGVAYALSPKHQLAQLAATGCLNSTFYAQAQDQLDTVLSLAQEVDPVFVAKTAVYARRAGHMKDMPALLAATLAVRDVACSPRCSPAWWITARCCATSCRCCVPARWAASRSVRGRRSSCSSGCSKRPKRSC